MKKLKNVKVFEINENKFDKFIFWIIESNVWEVVGLWGGFEVGRTIKFYL